MKRIFGYPQKTTISCYYYLDLKAFIRRCVFLKSYSQVIHMLSTYLSTDLSTGDSWKVYGYFDNYNSI